MTIPFLIKEKEVVKGYIDLSIVKHVGHSYDGKSKVLFLMTKDVNVGNINFPFESTEAVTKVISDMYDTIRNYTNRQ